MKIRFRLFGLIPLVLLINSCKKENFSLPILQTTYINNLTRNTVTSGGNIIDDGNATISTRGVCWSITDNPEISDSKTIDGSGIGVFTSYITGLIPNTTYFIRAFASNSVGTAYGEEFKFTTYKTDAISDIDNNFYNIVTIGTQVWITENLKTTRYNNADSIGTTKPFNKDISSELTPKYQWAFSNVAVYGRLYTWHAITDNRKVCPPGWHVPSHDEMSTLATYLGGESVAGGKLKEAGTRNWVSPNTGATNETGFTALPVGLRHSVGIFEYFRHLCYLWCSTEYSLENGNFWFMKNNETYFFDSATLKASGFSVRCLKD